MTNRTISVLAAGLMFLLPVGEAVAHGGGLDRHGCHRETATGGYHCHRSNKNDTNTLLYVAGGLIVVGIVAWLVLKDRDSANWTSEIAEQPDWGFKTKHRRNDSYFGTYWNLQF